MKYTKKLSDEAAAKVILNKLRQKADDANWIGTEMVPEKLTQCQNEKKASVRN